MPTGPRCCGARRWTCWTTGAAPWRDSATGTAGDAWELLRRSGDPHDRREAVRAAAECPAGRLTAVTKAGQPLEPEYVPAVEVLQDPEQGVSAGLFVKGGIPVESAAGFTYENRNRIVLCRCGASRTKPFCDASHIETGYNDAPAE